MFVGAGEFSPDRPRINTGQSGSSGDGSPLVGARVGGLRDDALEAEAFCIFAHNILKGYRKYVFRYIDIVRNKKEC